MFLSCTAFFRCMGGRIARGQNCATRWGSAAYDRVGASVDVAALLGLEPRQRDSESLVLPLHHKAVWARRRRLAGGLAQGS